MVLSATPRRPQAGRGRTKSMSSPVGGWNARDSLANMSPMDAVFLSNFYPATTECTLRAGYTSFATGLPGAVETLMAYSGAANDLFFAISGGSIYDITSGGAVGAADVTGLTNSRWQYVNITTSGGNFLYAANGTDKPLLFDGSTWTAIDGASTPAITGVTTTKLNNPCVFKNRLWFIEKDTLKAWYLPTSSIGGSAAAIDMSAVAQNGGYLLSIASWTIDAGAGVDDYFVAVTNKGEVIVYQGTDPSSSSSWALKGVWRLGSPIGSRCLFKYAGDLLIICQDGVLPLSGALQSSRVNPRVALTDKIQYAVSAAVSAYGGNFGWQLLYFAGENQLWLNVPLVEGSYQQQYVMNTISRAWSNYTGWNANCWEIFNDEPYFGGNGFVGKAWDGYSDNGSNINASALQAFNHFGYAGQLKRFTMARPIFRSDGTPQIGIAMNIDFNVDTNTAPLSFTPSTVGAWDSATWDQGVWGGDLSVIQTWQGVNGVGYYGAPQVSVASSGIRVTWVATEIVHEAGAIL